LINSERKTLIVRDKPRVFLSIRHYYPDGGGAEVLAHRLAVALKQWGLPVTVLTGRYGGGPRTEIVDGIKVQRHFIGTYVPVFHELCYLMSLAWELVARRHEYDIVHVFQTHLSAYVGSLIAMRLGKKLVTTSHGAGAGGDMAVWKAFSGGRKLLKTVCTNVDAATCVSRGVMDELRSAGFEEKNIWYIPNGVPLSPSFANHRQNLRELLGLPSKAFVAVFVGRLSVEKAPGFLLSTWPAIQKKRPDSILLFVGDGPERVVLEERVRQKGLEGSVQFSGRVDNVNDFLGAADVYVLPSTTEGMSLALLEAMAGGLAVVATRVGGTVDVIKDGENGLLFDVGDREGFVQCLAKLMDLKELRGELGKKARKTVEQYFNLNDMANTYLRLYGSLVGERPDNGISIERR
jgi:glycosyltransferase involved in cell wall biosynthesis